MPAIFKSKQEFQLNIPVRLEMRDGDRQERNSLLIRVIREDRAHQLRGDLGKDHGRGDWPIEPALDLPRRRVPILSARYSSAGRNTDGRREGCLSDDEIRPLVRFRPFPADDPRPAAQTNVIDGVHQQAGSAVALLTPILRGQTHGGIAQGVGQALLENSYYEPQSGQLLAASFMDYAMPRADTLPFLATALSELGWRPRNQHPVESEDNGDKL